MLAHALDHHFPRPRHSFQKVPRRLEQIRQSTVFLFFVDNKEDSLQRTRHIVGLGPEVEMARRAYESEKSIQSYAIRCVKLSLSQIDTYDKVARLGETRCTSMGVFSPQGLGNRYAEPIIKIILLCIIHACALCDAQSLYLSLRLSCVFRRAAKVSKRKERKNRR